MIRNMILIANHPYIALSRVQSKDNILVFVKDDQINKNTYTKNIVYKEIFI